MGQDLLAALALVLVLEGILPFVSPYLLRRAMLHLTEVGDSALRISGLMSMLTGAVLMYLVTH
jgi:uncharacterized protein YjeT (DUF2065 family)